MDNETVNIKGTGNQDILIKAKKYIIATGSKPSTIPGVAIDNKRIITSTEALNLSDQPNSIIIIGGGVIGVEMASIFNRIGTKVTILEYAEQLIATMDRDLGTELSKILSKEGVEIRIREAVYKTENLGNEARVWFKNSQGHDEMLSADYILLAVGRKPYTDNLGLENTGVELNANGTIKTNELLQTTVPHIHAIGDVTGGAMLAHKAEKEAAFVVEKINGQQAHIHYNRIPSVVYTWPEIASVGYTEEELKKRDIKYNIGKFPFAVNARARAGMETEGFAKVLSDPLYGELLGVHIIGPRASDLIAQAVAGMEFEITARDMASVCYAHPTYSEVMKEAYTIASGKASVNI